MSDKVFWVDSDVILARTCTVELIETTAPLAVHIDPQGKRYRRMVWIRDLVCRRTAPPEFGLVDGFTGSWVEEFGEAECLRRLRLWPTKVKDSIGNFKEVTGNGELWLNNRRRPWDPL